MARAFAAWSRVRPATSGRPPTPPRYCSTGTVRSCAGRTTRPTPPLSSRLQMAARDEPSLSGDDLVLWQVLRTSPSSWRSIRYTGSDPWFPGWRGRFRTCDLCRVNSATDYFGRIRNHEDESRILGNAQVDAAIEAGSDSSSVTILSRLF